MTGSAPTYCAVIDAATFDILNIIVAAPTDQAYPGTVLVAVPEGLSVGTTWRYTEALGFISPATQRFYNFAPDGLAFPVPVDQARATCVQDVADAKLERLTFSADLSYQAAVAANAVALTAAVAAYTFDQCVAFTPSGWPAPPVV